MKNKKENKSEVRILNFSNYSRPEIVETSGRQWVKYGLNDDYYQYIVERYIGSVTNSAIINGMSDMIYGLGIKAKDANTKPNEWAQFISLFRKEELKKVVMDFKLFGSAAIQCIYNGKHDKIVEVYHLPVQSLRAEIADEYNEVNGYYYSLEWTKPLGMRRTLYGKNKPVRIPAFGTSKEALEILFIKDYNPGFTYYTPPDYQSGLPYAELEEEIASYHINNIKNGFAPSTLINFNNGQASTNEEKAEIEKKVNQKFSGTAGNKIILSFNDTTESETNIQTIQLSDAHNQYQFLSGEGMTKILMAHRVTSPILFGIKDNVGLGNNAEEIQTSSIFMENTIIRPFRETILDNIDKILSFNKIALDLYFDSLQPWKTDTDGDIVGNGTENNTNTPKE